MRLRRLLQLIINAESWGADRLADRPADHRDVTFAVKQHAILDPSLVCNCIRGKLDGCLVCVAVPVIS